MNGSTKTMGPIVAHTSFSKIRIWLRAGEDILSDSRYVVGRIYESSSSTHKEEIKFTFIEEYDNIGLIEFGSEYGLQEDTLYKYSVGFLGNNGDYDSIYEASASTFSTNTNKTISFISGSCRHLDIRNSNNDISDYESPESDVKYGDRAFKSIIESSEGIPDFMMMTGDQVYCDHEEGTVSKKHPARELIEYYDNYYRAYQQAYFSSIGGQIPLFMSMDDHEIKNDWHMDMILNKDREYEENLIHYKNGLKAYLVYQASLSSVIKDVTRLKEELDDLANIDYEKNIDTEESPYDNHTKGLYYKYANGPARFFSLDVRVERYMNTKYPQMIGLAQQNALKEWLLENKSDEYVKFIISSVPVFPDTKDVFWYPFGAPEDKWGGYCEQRLNILEFIRMNNIRKVVFISGDVHVSLFSKIKYKNEEPGIYSIVSSGFTWPVPGLQRFNFDWKNIPERSIIKDKKRLPDSSSRGKYKPVKLSKWKWLKTGHREDNYCRVETNGKEMTVKYFKARNGKEFENIKITF